MTVSAPPESPQTTCGKCGAKAPHDAAWCPECGHQLGGTDPVVPSSSPGATEPSSGPVSEAMGAPSSAEEERPRLPRGTIIDNKYSIDRVLGEGGMGVVYLAEDVHTGVEVVLKAVRPELAHRKDVVSRTLGEGRTLARIDHPNVVHLNAVVADDSGLWLVMQYIQGESLDRTIKRYKDQGRAVAFTIAIDIFRQVLQGVAAAHREGVIHRDLKPANVLVRQKDGVAKVTDFGIAKPEQEARIGQGNTKGVIGSLWYMSPEQVQGRRDLDKRVDIYSLGILLFEVLSGSVPFDAESSYEIMRLHVEAPLPKVRAVRPDVPDWVDEVLARACAKERQDRYSTCEEFLATIDAHTSNSGRAVPRPPDRFGPEVGPRAISATETGAQTAPSSSFREPRSRWWMLIAVLIAAATIGGAYSVWRFAIYQPPTKKPKAVVTEEPPVEPTPPSPAASSIVLPGAPVSTDALAKLPGRWRSEAGTDFEAVRVGASVEFRIVDPKQFAGAAYSKGEARFILKRGADASTFFVEEKMRPEASIPFDPKSRTSCQEIWSQVDGKPLVATLDGAQLRVDFAKISIKQDNLKIEGGKVVSCSKLRGVAQGRGRTVLKKI